MVVDDIRAMADKLQKTGMKMLVPPRETDTGLACPFEDPDGIIVQIDGRKQLIE
jgi:predicted enzyme related to lactoylglutathione lyase